MSMKTTARKWKTSSLVSALPPCAVEAEGAPCLEQIGA